MMRFFRVLFLFSIFPALIWVMGSIGCGGDNASPGSQFQLDVEGTITVGDAANIQFGKAGIINGEQQVMIGVAIVEVSRNDTDSLGVNLLDFNATAQTNSVGEIKLIITPQLSGDGVLFKIDEFGLPFGISQINVPTTASIPQSQEQTIVIGDLNFDAINPDEASRLPVLSKIPAINFLFNNVNKRAEVNSLVMIMTPALVEVLEE